MSQRSEQLWDKVRAAEQGNDTAAALAAYDDFNEACADYMRETCREAYINWLLTVEE
jgi:hypothetical protein